MELGGSVEVLGNCAAPRAIRPFTAQASDQPAISSVTRSLRIDDSVLPKDRKEVGTGARMKPRRLERPFRAFREQLVLLLVGCIRAQPDLRMCASSWLTRWAISPPP